MVSLKLSKFGNSLGQVQNRVLSMLSHFANKAASGSIDPLVGGSIV